MVSCRTLTHVFAWLDTVFEVPRIELALLQIGDRVLQLHYLLVPFFELQTRPFDLETRVFFDHDSYRLGLPRGAGRLWS